MHHSTSLNNLYILPLVLTFHDYKFHVVVKKKDRKLIIRRLMCGREKTFIHLFKGLSCSIGQHLCTFLIWYKKWINWFKKDLFISPLKAPTDYHLFVWSDIFVWTKKQVSSAGCIFFFFFFFYKYKRLVIMWLKWESKKIFINFRFYPALLATFLII